MEGSFDEIFRRFYIYIQCVMLLGIGVGLFYVAHAIVEATRSQNQLLQHVRSLEASHPPTIGEDTKTAAERAFKDIGLPPEQTRDLTEAVVRELGDQMARETSGDTKRKFDEFNNAVNSNAPASVIAEKGAAVRPLLQDAVRRAAQLFGLSAGLTEKLVTGFSSLGTLAGKTLFEEIIRDAYKFMRDRILGIHESTVVCKCCVNGKGDAAPQNGPPIDTRDGTAVHVQSVIVYFPRNQFSINRESQVEEIWQARELQRQASTGEKLHLRAYTDPSGTEEYNRGLRDRRARAVAKALEGLPDGVDSRAIEIAAAERHYPPMAVSKESIPSNRVVVIDLY